MRICTKHMNLDFRKGVAATCPAPKINLIRCRQRCVSHAESDTRYQSTVWMSEDYTDSMRLYSKRMRRKKLWKCEMVGKRERTRIRHSKSFGLINDDKCVPNQMPLVTKKSTTIQSYHKILYIKLIITKICAYVLKIKQEAKLFANAITKK